MLPFTIWDFGLRGLLAERGRGGKLLRGSRDDSFLPTVDPGEEGEDWLELWPESEFAACCWTSWWVLGAVRSARPGSWLGTHSADLAVDDWELLRGFDWAVSV